MPADSATLDIILGTPMYYQQFYRYSVRNYREEHLEFLKAAESYRKNPSKTKATEIIDDYVKPGADATININANMATAIAAQGEAYGADRGKAAKMGFFKRHWTAGQRKAAENVFDSAIAEVRLLIITNDLKLFLKTPEGMAMDREITTRGQRALLAAGFT